MLYLLYRWGSSYLYAESPSYVASVSCYDRIVIIFVSKTWPTHIYRTFKLRGFLARRARVLQSCLTYGETPARSRIRWCGLGAEINWFASCDSMNDLDGSFGWWFMGIVPDNTRPSPLASFSQWVHYTEAVGADKAAALSFSWRLFSLWETVRARSKEGILVLSYSTVHFAPYTQWGNTATLVHVCSHVWFPKSLCGFRLNLVQRINIRSECLGKLNFGLYQWNIPPPPPTYSWNMTETKKIHLCIRQDLTKISRS
jgi:hypothetical protein